MTSPFQARIEQLIREERDLDQRAIYAAQIACYQARVGEFEKSDLARTELRRTYENGSNVKISIYLMLLEGLTSYFKDLDLSARDRIVRAQLLSGSFRERGLLALTSSWLAHIDFNRCHFSEMAANIDTTIVNLPFDDKSALCRMSLVLGDAFLFARQIDISKEWYERARQAATTLGDQAAIGALTYNRAALNVMNLRLSTLTGKSGTSNQSTVATEVNTAINYQHLARLRSLDHLLQAAQMGVEMVRCNYEVASKLGYEVLQSGGARENSGEKAVLLADLALCDAALGHRDDALSKERVVAGLLSQPISDDDRAITCSSIARCAETLSLEDMFRDYSAQTLSAKRKHDSQIRSLRSLLKPYSSSSKVLDN